MISIILPTHNRAKLLGRAIHSIISQTFTEWELIIVDDASTDDTAGMVADFHDRRIKYHRLDVNKGACYARNYGVDISQYDIIAFQDSDDYWHPHYLEIQFHSFRKNTANIQICRYNFSLNGESRTLPSTIPHGQTEQLTKLIKSNYFSPQIAVMSKALFREVGGFDESLPAFQDFDIAIRILERTSITQIRDVLAYVEVFDDSITRNPLKRIAAIHHILKKYQHHWFASLLTRNLLRIGYYLCAAHNCIAERRSFLILSVKKFPLWPSSLSMIAKEALISLGMLRIP